MDRASAPSSIKRKNLPSYYKVDILSLYTKVVDAVWLVDFRHQQMVNSSMPMEVNDVTDFASLAPAVAYCDFVVTEKRWAHFARVLGVETTRSCVVLSKLEDLIEHLSD